MHLDEREIEKVVDRLTRLKSAVIDSSSIIYLDKATCLDKVASAVRLVTLPEVVEETGMRELPVEIVKPPGLPENLDTDRLLFAAALALNKAMISEDRAILLKCRAEGIEYYNSYNMLVMLLARRLIESTEFTLFEQSLLEAAHYGGFVIGYIESLKQYLRKAL